MHSLSDALLPEIAQQLHPAWRQNETTYWANRGTLLHHYRDQWIGYANGRVIAAGTSAVDVLHAAQASGLHPFVTCVGREHEPCRIRTIDPLNVNQWQFYVLPTAMLDARTRSQHSITLKSLEQLSGGAVHYTELRKALE